MDLFAFILIIMLILVLLATVSGLYNNATITHKTYFDIELDGVEIGRIVFGLFGKVVPKTVENFRGLCTGEYGLSADRHKMHYQGTSLFRIITDFVIQGGDFVNNDGTGGESIYVRKFLDENFDLSHKGPGVLSMANSGPNSNTSQFFITLSKILNLDFKYVVFGEVIQGMDVVEKIGEFGTDEGKPKKKIVIKRSGEIVG
jgi:peptidylprolyl isomerase